MDKDQWDRLRPLMDRALEMTVSEREAWMSALRSESPTIAAELERLLAGEGTLDRRGFLDTPGADLGELLSRLGAAQSTGYQRAQLEQSLANRYTLGAELGRGGMATVFRARDERHGRDVAIKVIRPDAASAVGAERFLAEIRLTAQLTHPNILPLLDSGESGGVLYYVMPFIEGESLRARLRRDGALPVDDVTRVARAVGEALAYAHGKGAVHRDIKPDNVLVSGRQAWVADFGIAKAMANSVLTQHAVTSVGVTLGSPGYMAPEQIEGRGAVDHRADLYSLGAMLWELLAGKPVFDGANMQQLFTQHLTVLPQAIDQVRPGVPPALAGVVMRCLEKDAGLRWQSADEVLHALDQAGAVSGAQPSAAVATLAKRGMLFKVGVPLLALAVAGVALWPRTPSFVPLAQPVRLTPVSDFNEGAVSPTGLFTAFRRQSLSRELVGLNIWVQHRDSTAPFKLADSVAGRLAWLSDSVLAVLPRAGNPRTFLLPVARETTLPHLSDSGAVTWFVARAGVVLQARARADDPRVLSVRRADPAGWRDSIEIVRDSGERTSCMRRAPYSDRYVMCSVTADSSIRLSTISLTGKRTVVHVISADSVKGKAYLRGTPHLNFGGRYLDMWIRFDSLRRYDMDRPGTAPVELGGEVPGRLFEYTAQGHAVVRRPSDIGTVWQIPLAQPDQAERLERTEGLMDLATTADGQMQARVERTTLGDQLVMVSLSNGVRRPIATSRMFIRTPVWSPDGTRIAYRRHLASETAAWMVHDLRDGSERRFGSPATKLGSVGGATPVGLPPAWSPDGRFLFAVEYDSMPRNVIRRFDVAVPRDTGVRLAMPPPPPAVPERTDLPIGLVVSPDGANVAYGGRSLVITSTQYSSARVLIAPDTALSFLPVAWLLSGEVIYAAGRSVAFGFQELWKITLDGKRTLLGQVSPGCHSVYSVIRTGPTVTCVSLQTVSEAYLYNPIANPPSKR